MIILHKTIRNKSIKTFCSLICLLILSAIQGQDYIPFIDENKVWVQNPFFIEGGGPDEPDESGNFSFRFNGTEIINGITYFILEQSSIY